MDRFLIILFCIAGVLEAKPLVLVTIQPQKFFVEQVGGEAVDVLVLVPPGASPHSFEPTAKQIVAASQADIWVRLGEPFEAKAMKVLLSHNPHLLIADMRENIELISSGCSHCADEGDTHIWLSPQLAQIEAKTIERTLTKKIPEKKEYFEERTKAFVKQLAQINEELRALFQDCGVHMILVSHPAFGYFCKDFGLEQLSIEMDGKEPSSRQLTLLLEKARKAKITRIFAQEQYQNKGAELIAKELKAELYNVDPYSSDYLNNLKRMGRLFAGYDLCH